MGIASSVLGVIVMPLISTGAILYEVILGQLVARWRIFAERLGVDDQGNQDLRVIDLSDGYQG